MVKSRILLMEDDTDFRNYARGSLEKAGFDVAEVCDGINLEQILKSKHFDLILSDTNLENMDGYLACKRAIEKGLIKDVLIVGMSGDQKNQKYWAGIANFNGFYNKLDFEKKEIGVFISNYLKLARANLAIYSSKMLASGVEEE